MWPPTPPGTGLAGDPCRWGGGSSWLHIWRTGSLALVNGTRTQGSVSRGETKGWCRGTGSVPSMCPHGPWAVPASLVLGAWSRWSLPAAGPSARGWHRPWGHILGGCSALAGLGGATVSPVPRVCLGVEAVAHLQPPIPRQGACARCHVPAATAWCQMWALGVRPKRGCHTGPLGPLSNTRALPAVTRSGCTEDGPRSSAQRPPPPASGAASHSRLA